MRPRPLSFLMVGLVLLEGCSKKEAQNPPTLLPTPVPAILMVTPTPVHPGFLAAVPSATPGLSTDDLEYVFDEIKGTVLVREDGQGAAVTAERDLVVDPGDEILTGPGSEATLTLDQDTLFHLSENSDLKVAELGRQGDQGFLSRLTLLKGKVLSEVEKLAEKHSTFEVESGGVVCGVRGTGFEVQKDGEEVHTRTFHGLVEMRRGSQVQQVKAGIHGIFQGGKGMFLPVRALGAQEKSRYQGWLKLRSVVRERQQQRFKALMAFQRLDPTEKGRVLEGWKGTDRREKFKFLRGAVGGPKGWAPRPGGPLRSAPAPGPKASHPGNFPHLQKGVAPGRSDRPFRHRSPGQSQGPGSRGRERPAAKPAQPSMVPQLPSNQPPRAGGGPFVPKAGQDQKPGAGRPRLFEKKERPGVKPFQAGQRPGPQPKGLDGLRKFLGPREGGPGNAGKRLPGPKDARSPGMGKPDQKGKGPRKWLKKDGAKDDEKGPEHKPVREEGK